MASGGTAAGDSGSERSFVHLHVHSEYSMLDGAARVGDLFAEAARMGMPALAVTDHGNVFGAYEFWKKGRAAGVKPIIGMEAYLTPATSRFERTRVRWADGGEDDVSGGGAFTHMTLLAETTVGMHNLFRLASRSSLEGYFYKPRADRELLAEHADGLIATTGCPSGEIQTRLRLGDYAAARTAAAELQDIFGRDSFFVEMMDHGLGIEQRVHADLIRLSADLGIPTLATNDLHYTYADDAESHEVLLCVQSGKTMADPNRFKFDARDFYLKTPGEMRHTWRELPEACDNTLLIAERCDVTFDENADLMPRFEVPDDHTEESWLRAEVARGLESRFPGGVHPPLPAQPFERPRRVDDLLHVGVGLVQRPELLGLAVPLVPRVEDPAEWDVLAHHRGRHRFRDPVAEPVGIAQDPGGILDRGLRLDRAVGDDLADPVLAVLLGGVADHVAASTLVEIQVDVRHRDPLGVEEALEQQSVLDRVELGDPQRVGDERAGCRPPARPDPDP